MDVVSMKVTLKPKKFGDPNTDWKKLLDKIGPAGDDFKIISIIQRTEQKWFHARVEGEYIIIERAKNHMETAKINGTRRINFNQFQCVAQLYNEYAIGTRGVSTKMRAQCGQNTSYIISLIAVTFDDQESEKKNSDLN